MIKLLKNKEVRKALLWQLLLSAAACAVCFFFDIRAGLTAAGLSLLLMLVFCILYICSILPLLCRKITLFSNSLQVFSR